MAEVDEVVPAAVISDLLKTVGGKIPKGQRVYRVIGIGGEVRHVLSNSPGNASLCVVSVELCSNKEIMEAAVAALSEMAKGTK